eukprot:TRINITY_DN7218_c0_g2_i1.p1 TRINITY_DN7218_c0_g2~~TRINITY_DN7218_c0_g2_i1.p1  ORF type:complete len:158 (-),score=27.99 TRINITY_DN7218_c0_g2_i1:19-492(-)
MIRRPPRSTQGVSSAASDVYKRQTQSTWDFGLAVILQPNELANDPVGTLCYAAPEILLGMKYSVKVDMWSLGVLSYLVLSGCFPFSPELSEKEIAHLIIDKDVTFSEPSWNKRTNEAKDFVKKLLTRDPRFRMSTKEVFNHPWVLLQHPTLSGVRKP